VEALTVSIVDAAKALGLGRTTIYMLIKSGRLEARKIGGRNLVTVESIRRLVTSQGDCADAPVSATEAL